MEKGTLNEIEKTNVEKSIILGENIRRKRVEQNVSQEYLAEMLDISRQSVSKWENGLSEPSAKNLTKLASIFGCDIAELLARESAAAKEHKCFAYVGIALEASCIRKMRCFFREMPSDVMGCYDTSFVIICDGDEQTMEELEYIIELNVERSVIRGDARTLFEPDPNGIYLIRKKNYGGSFDDFFDRAVRLYGEMTVAVLLTDSEHDGIRGISQVKRAGGMSVLCENSGEKGQNLQSVPDRAFNYVLEPVSMGYWIASYIRREWLSKREQYRDVLSERFRSRLWASLQAKSVYSFPDIRMEYVLKPILERIDKNGLLSAEHYLQLVESSEQEQDTLIADISSVIMEERRQTGDFLEIKTIISKMKPEKNGIRIWIAGCGRGLEAYGVVMLLLDYMERYDWGEDIKIFATDTREDAVSRALEGRFRHRDVAGLPKQWLDKYFTESNSIYQVKESVRDKVIFSTHDILTNPPFARINLLICRNALMKYRIRSRKTMMMRFAYSLVRGGYLVLGRSEDMSELSRWFLRVERYEGRVWKKSGSAPHSLEMQITETEPFSIGNVVQEMLVASMPSCIIVDERYEILYIGKDAGRYLQFKTGRFSKNLFDNVDIRISVLIDIALKYLQEGEEWQEVMPLKKADGAETEVNIHVLGHTIRNRSYYLIWFEESVNGEVASERREGSRKREEKLERELQISQDKLYQSLQELDETRDKYELINEKLQSTNEELILMNDELQMVNQELAASNRKLTRVNADYQKKMNEMPDFSVGDIDFFNLLGLELVFLDKNMTIKKISKRTPGITNVKEQDLERDIRTINFMNGYLGWQDDLAAAEHGNKVFRVVNGEGGGRFIIEIFPYLMEEYKTPGYIIAVQKIEKGGK